MLANLVTKLNHQGKKGDTIYIPSPNRGDAAAVTEGGAVTLIAHDDNSNIAISINQHFHYARQFNDEATALALDSLRQFYTDDAGYALAKQVDTSIWTTAYKLQGGDGNAANFGDRAYIGSNGDTLYTDSGGNEAVLSDAGIREAIYKLDVEDVPMDNRFFIVPAAAKRTLTGIPRYTEQAFVGEAAGSNTIRTGLIGDLYGMPVYVSNNAPTASDATVCLMAHKSAIVLAEAMGVRTQTQYKLEFLGELFVADTLYGVEELRDEAGLLLAVPA